MVVLARAGNNQSIKKIKKKYYLIVVDVNPLSAGLYWGDERYLVPYANSVGYLESIKIY